MRLPAAPEIDVTLRVIVTAFALLSLPVEPARAGAKASPSAASRPTSLAALSDDLETISAQVERSVVQVHASGYAPAEGEEAAQLLARSYNAGSGVILDAQGFIATNAHLVAGAQRVVVALARPDEEGRSIVRASGRKLDARIVGLDLETDLALLQVDAAGLPALPLADSDEIRPGQIVLAFGAPAGLANSVAMGVVSAVARQLEPDHPMIYIQTDAPINPGNSGGPLVDAEGRMVGINTLILSRSGGSEGIGFAAPSNIVRTVVEQLRDGGRVRRGQIGAQTQTIDPALALGLDLPVQRGVVVADVVPGGPAAAAGLRVGDIVLALDGKPMENARQLEVNLYRRRVGSTVALTLLRGAEKLVAAVPVVERQDDASDLAALVTPEENVVLELGILALPLDERVRPLLPPLRQGEGLVVAASVSDGKRRTDSLAAGDVIYTVNRRPVRTLDELRAVLASTSERGAFAVQVERQGRLRFVTFERE